MATFSEDDFLRAAEQKEAQKLREKDLEGLDEETKKLVEEKVQERLEQVQRKNANDELQGKEKQSLPSESELRKEILEEIKTEEKEEDKTPEQIEEEKKQEEERQKDIADANDRFLKKKEHIDPIGTTQKPVLKPKGEALNAPVLWAQRPDQIFVSINLQDIKNQQILVEEDKFTFIGESAGKTYQTEFEFYGEIDPSKSKYAVKPRAAEFVLIKKEEGPYWPRLLKNKGKFNWLKVDWDKWIDEDELEEEQGFDMGGMSGFGGQNFDFSALQGLNQQEEEEEEEQEVEEEEEVEENEEKKDKQ